VVFQQWNISERDVYCTGIRLCGDDSTPLFWSPQRAASTTLYRVFIKIHRLTAAFKYVQRSNVYQTTAQSKEGLKVYLVVLPPNHREYFLSCLWTLQLLHKSYCLQSLYTGTPATKISYSAFRGYSKSPRIKVFYALTLPWKL
jgi:hypothetical protein